MRNPDTPELGRAIARVLRAGSLVAVAGIAIGYVLALLGGGSAPANVPIIEQIGNGGPDALIGGGLLVLALTPLTALAVAAWALYRSGERRPAAVAGVVVLALAASVVLAAIIGRSI